MMKILLSEKAGLSLRNYLKIKGHTVINIGSTGAIPGAIGAHPDLYGCALGGSLVVEPAQLTIIEPDLRSAGVAFESGAPLLGQDYPGHTAYNAAAFGRYFVHNLAHTDEVLLNNAKKLGLTLIDVKQGYTKCNLVLVSDDAVITSDAGIAASLAPYPISVLLIQKGHVALPGFNHGFLGGASGRVSGVILFNGDLSRHPDFDQITSFIENHGAHAVYFKDYALEDIGSVIAL
jgi:hypothetical protein